MKNNVLNGFCNHHTWIVYCWLCNDSRTFTFWHNTARQVIFTALHENPLLVQSRKALFQRAQHVLAKRLECQVDAESPLWGDSGLYSDLLALAMCDVDWLKIASLYLRADFVEDAVLDWQRL